MRTILALAILFLLPWGQPARAADRPNVILIMTDDQGYGDFGFQGNAMVDTPSLDAISKESAQWDRFYVSPVCSPTRASLMTGRYHMRTGVVDTFKGRSMMDPGEETLAEALLEAGYATGVFGKWHLGDNYPMRPMDQGFEESLIHRGGGLAQPSEPIENQRRYTDAILFRNGEQESTKGYCTDVYFDAAMAFIEERNEDSRPFFVYLATNAPHGPYHDVPEDLYQKYLKRDLASVMHPSDTNIDRLARIFAMIENIDQNVGRLDSFLESTGRKEDTMVIFMVDNGPNTRRYAGAFRGMKSEVYEGGIRSPLLWRWPAVLEPGFRRGSVAAHIDLFPTIIDLCGVARSGSLPLDGVSLAPVLKGVSSQVADRSVVIQAHRGDRPVARHNAALIHGDWKLVFPTGFQKESPGAPAVPEVYNLSVDPGETNDLASKEPERLQRLLEAYDTWFQSVDRSRDFDAGPPEIVFDAAEERHSVLTRQDWRVGRPEGWGSEGRWHVSNPTAGDYEVQMAFLPMPTAGEVELRIGERVERKPLSELGVAQKGWLRFGTVALESGSLRLSARIVGEDGESEVYQMAWRRVGR